MHIAIIGAAGMVGRKLTQRLSNDGHLGETPVEKLTLIDIVAAEPPKGFAGSVDTLAADISTMETAQKIVSGRPDVIFHLAAIVSGEAELDFDKGYRINLDGTRHLFDAIRRAHIADGYKPRVVFTSSIAVFGAPLPYPIPDEFHTTPLTSYGTQKAIQRTSVVRLHPARFLRRHRHSPANDLHTPRQTEQGCIRLFLQYPA
jgi:D-erythronate 2-dehydrogenase